VKKNPTIVAFKGAKKPIMSREFCDWFPADLIDFWSNPCQCAGGIGGVGRWLSSNLKD
jgi:hypothetical protein